MQLEKYKGVIRRVYEKHSGLPFEEFFAKMTDSIEIAAEIMGENSLSNTVSIETYAHSNLTGMEKLKYEGELRGMRAVSSQAPSADPFKGAILISSAPPVAGAIESGAEAEDDDVDYYESKPGKGDGANRLQQKLQSIMPRSITVQVPGIDTPLTLSCGIGSPGTKFAHVNYCIPGDTLGPRVTVMTSQKDLSPEEILKDIVAQAAAMYSKEKRVITPRSLPASPPPSNQELEQMLARDRSNQAPVSQEDHKLAGEWSQSRSPRWQ